MVQGAGSEILHPSLTKAAFTILDATFHPKGTFLFDLSRLYSSTIGIAVVLTFICNNTQAMHVAPAKDLTTSRPTAPPLMPRV